MNSLILPNTYIENIDNPLIYLAGPIRSAPNWQEDAIELLFSNEKDLTIASPRMARMAIDQYVTYGDEDNFKSQREWEWHYMHLASQQGAILFWLPAEYEHHCDKVYGAVTRIELGQWMTRNAFDSSLRVCYGSDWHFPEIYLINYDLGLHAPEKKIHRTLKDTCDEALRLACG